MANAKWSRGDRTQPISSAPTFSGGDLVVTLPAFNASKCRTTRRDVTSGKYYVEVTPTWSGTPNTQVQIGIKRGRDNIESSTGNALDPGVGFNCGVNRAGTKLSDGVTSTAAAGASFTSGDVVGLAIDLDNKELYMHVNGTWMGGGDPATNTNPLFTALGVWEYGVVVNNASAGVAVTFTINTGDSAFAHSVPSGYTSGLPDRDYTAPAGASTVHDTFTDSDGTLLQAHTPETGGAWALFGGSTGNSSIQSNEVVYGGSGTSRYANDDVAVPGAGDDYSVYLKTVGGGNNVVSVLVNRVPGAETYYMFTSTSLQRVVAGAFTALGTTGSASAATELVVHVETTADWVRLRLFRDGVLTRDYIDDSASRLSTAGETGFILSSTAQSVDEFATYDGFSLSIPVGASANSEVSGGGDIVTTARGLYRSKSVISGGGDVITAALHEGARASTVSGGGAVVTTASGLAILEAGFVLHAGHALEVGFVLDSRGTTALEASFVLTSPLRTVFEAGFVLTSDIENVNVLERGFTLTSPLLPGVSAPFTTALTVTINGQAIPLDAAIVSQDEGQYAWTCRITLHDPRHYQLFERDDAFTVHLPDEDYAFIVEGKAFARGGQVDLSATVEGISPAAEHAAPRAVRVTKTWDSATLASAVATELLGADSPSWSIIDWSIPAFRLGAENQTPIEIVQRICRAAGATLESDPDGTLVVRYLYPVSVPAYETATPDQDYHDASHNFTIREGAQSFEVADKLRVLDIEPSARSDSVEFEQDPQTATKGTLRVFPQPWRTELTVEHTSDDQVSATLVGVETEELTETVEVIAGRGSVSKPIYTIEEVNWLYQNLTGIAFESDSTEFTTTHATLKESLVQITYTTRFIKYKAATVAGIEDVQYLVREAA